jgi:hypothetical protein
MEMPAFHDGYFDGLWIGPNKLIHFFLRTVDEKRFTLILRDVEHLTLVDVKQGNIILDLVVRGPETLELSDIVELYGVRESEAITLLTTTREQGFQLLEVNPSYGAQGLVLFRQWDLSEGMNLS